MTVNYLSDDIIELLKEAEKLRADSYAFYYSNKTHLPIEEVDLLVK